MIDSFYIGAYWKDRKETFDQVINPTLHMLKAFGELDNLFENIFELGMSRAQAMEKKISLSSDSIKHLYEKRLKNVDFDQDGYSKIGFRLSVWTGYNENEASQISLIVGSSSSRITNNCLIYLPIEGVARDRILKLDKVKIIMSILIKDWDPNIIVLNSKELSNELDTTNEIGWVTFVKKLKYKPKLSSKIIHESDFHDGHLFYLNPSNGFAYDYSLINELFLLKKELIFK